ncbi:heavy metal-responsive transcriptional regulator [Microvenator marinus]|uniref:Heavy metal-responsive transcriptional regulator n=1 Tax=Microvenator marinus TaxID=2600177 RepID=A0A5B8XXE1_9DELT|nr:heavy metal-responsive transcriptional regulator [Microvenator marinus]QED28119.1 heavy metal-responsive transcriptional regulator [Microvenator marinus]
MQSNVMRIGEVAERCEVSTDTLRYYEKRGLVDEPLRFESSGYRAYPPEIIERVLFIKQAQQLGFTLAEIGRLLKLRADLTASCGEVREVARQKIDGIRVKITYLERMLEGIEELARICPGDVPANICPIVAMLSSNQP